MSTALEMRLMRNHARLQMLPQFSLLERKVLESLSHYARHTIW